jgi:hypothetical protein
MMHLLGVDPTSDGGTSPTIWDDEDSYVIQGWRVDDARRLAEIGQVPAHETVVRIPKRMMQFFPEVSSDGRGTSSG